MTFDVSVVGEQLDQRTAYDIATDAIDLLQVLLPGWVARNGSPEVVYLEAVALGVAEIVNAGNEIIGALLEALLGGVYQIPRLAGSVASGQLTVTFDSTVTTTIPAGTAFLLTDYATEVVSIIDVDVSATDTADVAVSTAVGSSALNGVDDAVVDVLDVIPNALSVEVSGAFSGGSDPEDDATWLLRARNRLMRFNTSLVVLDNFTAYVLEDGRASNAATIGAWDGAVIGTAGTDGGYVGVVTYGKGDQLSSTVRDELAAAMQAITAEGITVAVVDADLEVVPVTATVQSQSGEDTSIVRQAVEQTVAAYLDPETWEFGETVRTTTLTALLAGVPGVDYVDSLDAPAADVTLTANQLASAGTLTISVT